MIGRTLTACPCCGSKACAIQSPKGCRHTRHPRPAAVTVPPAADTKPVKPKPSTSNKGRNPEKES